MRSLSMTHNGRFVVIRRDAGLHVFDALGPAPPRVLPSGEGGDIACIGDEAWWIGPHGEVRRIALAGPRFDEPRAAAAATVPLPAAVDTLVASTCGTAMIASHTAEGCTRSWRIDRASLAAAELEIGGARVLAAHGRTVVTAAGGDAAIVTLGRRDVVVLAKPGGVALAAAFVLGGRAVAVHVCGGGGDAIVVWTLQGKLVHRIATPALVSCAFADDANLAVGATTTHLNVFDLRYGRIRTSRESEEIRELVVDRRGRHVVVADREMEISRVALDEIFAAESAPAPVAVVEEVAEVAEVGEVGEVAKGADVDDGSVPVEVAPPPAKRVAAFDDDRIPLALAAAAAGPAVRRAASGAAQCAASFALPYRDVGQHLSALLDVVAARVALAIAESWHSGRTSHDGDGDLPCEREVLGLLGEDVGLAADALRAARVRLRERGAELAMRTEASLAAGLALPFHAVANEYGLSPIATQILVCAAAPRLRTSIARLYGVLAGVAGRSACTDHLLEMLVEAEGGGEVGHALAVELAPDAPLVAAGLVLLAGRADRVEVTVDAVLADRLRGIDRASRISDATTRRGSDRELADVIAPEGVKRALLDGLAMRESGRHARIVVRGRRGSGRHTLVATLAARAGRTIAEIDVSLVLRRDSAALVEALACELRRAALADCMPVLSGLEAVSREGDAWIQVTRLLARHPGPLAVRAPADVELPLAAERLEVELPALSLGERAAAWSGALAARALGPLDADAIALLSARFKFGPGTIVRVTEHVARSAARMPGRVAPAALVRLVDEAARQHIAGRLARSATRVTRLPDWDQVTLADDMRDSVRELIGRMKYQRTVYEDWGFDARITTARGLTALFYGPPGTGKTLVAGLVGRELGLDVWRIDLARVTSKWLGETEKSLADVFEAAEEGQVLLLFDEADSLFGKRSEVKSSNDRYANLETNYLLQRLDAFEGVAILTTNLDGSIDPAFKRRLSMRLYFAFPDEEQRQALWAAHVPASVPCAGRLDFANLARRYPLSGGYIRNSALRAAFLAAQEHRPLSQDHLERAVQLEYRELGKLSPSGRMD